MAVTAFVGSIGRPAWRSVARPLVRAGLSGPRAAAVSTAIVDAEAVARALEGVQARIRAASAERPVQLVAVSKFKPAAAVAAALEAGQLVFGENYVQELLDKAPMVSEDARWHFIGKLQSNKARKLVAGVPNLVAVETVDSASLADKLAAAAAAIGRGSGASPPLDAYVQVDTSGEDSKGGVPPSEAPALAAHVAERCGPGLRFAGLMTIGAPGDLSAFETLAAAREAVAKELGMPAEEVGLSMGMSGDYEEAIQRGATSVRVGSQIFGARPPK